MSAEAEDDGWNAAIELVAKMLEEQRDRNYAAEKQCNSLPCGYAGDALRDAAVSVRSLLRVPHLGPLGA